MKTYRILAELNTLYEIYVEAENPEDAMEQARVSSRLDFDKFDPRGGNDFIIIEDSCEEIENEQE
jgi:hypothetical protein